MKFEVDSKANTNKRKMENNDAQYQLLIDFGCSVRVGVVWWYIGREKHPLGSDVGCTGRIDVIREGRRKPQPVLEEGREGNTP